MHAGAPTGISPAPFGAPVFDRAGPRGLPLFAGVVVLMALAAALRLPFLGTQSLWFDEVVTAQLVSGGLGEMLEAIPDSESTPPLYYVLLWLWMQVVGAGDAALRSLSAIAGILTVPAAYAAGSALATRRIGLIVATFAAVNPLLVWYSDEARAYALLVLLCTLSLASFAAARLQPRAGTLAAWALASAGALATHYFAIFLVLPTAAWLLARVRPGGRVVAAVGAVVAAGGALLPLALHQRAQGGADFIADIPFVSRAGQSVKQFLIGYEAPLQVPLTIVCGLVVVGGVALVLTRAGPIERDGARVAAWIGGAAIALPVVAAVFTLDYFLTRNLLPAWAALAVVVAAGLGARRSGSLGLGLAAVLVAIWAGTSLAVAVDDGYQRTDWRGVARDLGPAPSSGRGIALTPASGGEPLERYLGPLEPYPPDGAAVSELALVAADEGRTGQSVEPPRPTGIGIPPELGLALERRVVAPTYTILLYRSSLPEPAVIFPDALAAFRLSLESSFQTLLQPPPGGG